MPGKTINDNNYCSRHLCSHRPLYPLFPHLLGVSMAVGILLIHWASLSHHKICNTK